MKQALQWESSEYWVRVLVLVCASFCFFAPASEAQNPGGDSSARILLAPHPEDPIEWWYLTGIFDHHGTNPTGGFEATFFRFTVPSENASLSTGSPWSLQTIISNHAALTDAKQKTRRHFIWAEKTRRSFRTSIFIKRNPFEIRQGTSYLELGDARGTLKLREEFGGRILDLTLTLPKTPLWEDPSHQLVTGDGPEDRAFYYSYPKVLFSGKRGRVSDKGTVTWEKVSGIAWFDHEWTKSALGKKQAGWLWMGLRLQHGDLMAYQMEKSNGPDNHRGGTFLFTDGPQKGTVLYLKSQDIRMTALSFSLSQKTGICRPRTIRVTIPSLQVDGVVAPILSDQELSGSPPYWEGAVRFGSKQTNGEGYLEMTGKLDLSKCTGLSKKSTSQKEPLPTRQE